jgi:hypothetical protein
MLSAACVLVLAWNIHPAGQGPVTPATGTATISGTVKSVATGNPIVAAVVTVSISTPGAMLRTSLRQLTDAQGRFVFRDLPAGRGYSVTATRAGFIDAEFGQTVPFGPAERVTLTEGQWFNRAEILMWKPGAVSGRIVDEHGDPAVGVYVRVLAQQLIAGHVRLLAGAAAKTDDRGEYRIAGLLPGRYLVAVPSVQSTVLSNMSLKAEAAGSETTRVLERQLFSSSLPRAPRVDGALDLDATNRLIVGNYLTPPATANGRSQTYPITFHPSVTAVASAVAVELRAAEERRGVDIALRPVAAVRVAGRVQGPLSDIAGSLLRLMPAGLEELGTGSEAATTFVDAEGRFVFLNVAAGSYTIDARRAVAELTFASAGSGEVLPAIPGAEFSGGSTGSVLSGPPGSGYNRRSAAIPDLFWTRTPITVGSADIDTVVVPMHRGVVLRGRLIFEGTTRAVATAPAGGIASAGSSTVRLERAALPERMPTIDAEPANADLSLGIRQSGSPAVDGDTDTFGIDGLASGDYVLRVRAGLNQYMVKSIQAGGRDVTHLPISITAGRNVSDVVITFTDQLPTLSGTVQGDAAALSHAAVIVFPVEREQWIGYGLRPTRILAQPVSGAAFRFDSVPAGEYFVVAVDVSQITSWQDPKFLARAAAVASRVRVDWGGRPSVGVKLARIQ